MRLSNTFFKKFKTRADAGTKLAEKLLAYSESNPLVLAIPRGGVPIAAILAETLDGELDVVLVRKLRAPFNPEFALGAVDETGAVHLNNSPYLHDIPGEYLEEEKSRQINICRQRREQYTSVRQPISPKDRVVIVVDDGLATGATMIAALEAIRAKEPKELITAVPVAHPDSHRAVAAIADTAIALFQPADFRAVGLYYRDFAQVDDNEVIRFLESGKKLKPAEQA